jgi:hypothetical protein
LYHETIILKMQNISETQSYVLASARIEVKSPRASRGMERIARWPLPVR